MSIAAVLKVVLFVFAGISLLAAFRMLLVGMRSRGAASSQFFNVGRLEARRKVFSSMLSTVGLVLLALLFLIGAVTLPDDFLSSDTVIDEGAIDLLDGEVDEPVASEETSETPNSLDSEPAVAQPTISPTPVPIETLEPTPTATPTREYVYVDSPVVGLYMRDLPSGDIIDVLDDRSRLSLSGESTIVNDITWILVLTDDDREGWVAEQFTTVTLLAPIESATEPSPDS